MARWRSLNNSVLINLLTAVSAGQFQENTFQADIAEGDLRGIDPVFGQCLIDL